MRTPLSAFIALRFIRSKTTGGFLSFITWISMLGLILGVAALIIVTSVLNGFEQALTTRILGMYPQAAVLSGDGIPDWQDYAQKMQDNDPNILGVAPFVMTRGMSSINGEVHGTLVNGIDPTYQGQVSILPEVMFEGSMQSLQPGAYNILLGKDLVEERGLHMGDSVSIIIAYPDNSVVGINPAFHNFTLSGVFDVSRELDYWMSYIHIGDAAAIMGVSDNPQGLRLKLRDVMSALETAQKAGELLVADDIAYSPMIWQTTHQSLYDSIQRQKRMMAVLLFLIIIVAVFNVVSALTMMTTEKRSQIAILQTFGASKKEIMRIFLYQGLVIGLMGSAAGLVLGVGLTLTIEDISRWVNTTFNLGLFDNYYVTALPAKINTMEVVATLATSLIVCVLASIYPAIKAANAPPVEAL